MDDDLRWTNKWRFECVNCYKSCKCSDAERQRQENLRLKNPLPWDNKISTTRKEVRTPSEIEEYLKDRDNIYN